MPTPVAHLSEHERSVILECLRAVADGPFFGEAFHSLMGLWPEEVARIVADWPQVDDSSEDVQLAINNSMLNLLGYPHRCEDVWSDWISVSKLEVGRVYAKWLGDPGDATYFDLLR